MELRSSGGRCITVYVYSVYIVYVYMCIECICVYILPLLPLHYTHTLTSNPLVSTHIHITHTHTHTLYIEQTSDRIQWFGILSIFVLLTISCWQVLYLRHFFTTKKLL